MKYKVTGTRGQFQILSEAVKNYSKICSGEEQSVLLMYFRMAFMNRYQQPEMEINTEWKSVLSGIITKETTRICKSLYSYAPTKEEIPLWREQADKYHAKLKRIREILDDDIICDGGKQEKLSFEFAEECLRELSNICNHISRMICGQTLSIIDLLMAGYYYSKPHDLTVDSGPLIDDLEDSLNVIHSICWHTANNHYDGVHYNEEVDSLFDDYQIFRHAIWEDTPDGEKSNFTVNADTPTNYSSKHKLLTIERIKEDK